MATVQISEASGQPTPQRARQIFQAAIRYAQGSSRPALCIAPECQGGILIKKSHYSDFIGPGAAVVNRHDIQGNKIIPVGRLKFLPLKTAESRQLALGKRLEYLRALEVMARSPVALRRSCLIIEQLCQWLPEKDAQAIPHELVASLVGVTPTAIQLAWRSYQSSNGEMGHRGTTLTGQEPEAGDQTRSCVGQAIASGSEIPLEGEVPLDYLDPVGRSRLQSRLPSLYS